MRVYNYAFPIRIKSVAARDGLELLIIYIDTLYMLNFLRFSEDSLHPHTLNLQSFNAGV